MVEELPLPLLPLTEGGDDPAAVDIMIEELIAAQKTDLLWIGYVMAGKVFAEEELPWLKRRFAVLNDFLWDSPVYQEIMSHAKEEGRAEGVETGKMEALSQSRREIQQNFIELVIMHYPELEGMARQCAERAPDTRLLMNLIFQIGATRTAQDARHVLEEALQG